MSIIRIEEARREGAKVVIGLAGTSGSGKTYTALLLGYGLAKKQGKKLGFLDTENRRGRLYADVLGEPFMIGDLVAPFSPSRYIEAIQAFEKAGCEVLIVDSGTHEWEGVGGCEEIANEGNPKFPRWNKAKAEHKRFMNSLLQSSMHIVICFRAREKVKIEKGDRGENVVIPLGLQPITEKNVMFEMTASLMMDAEGARQDVLKCPAALRQFLGREQGYIGITDGEAIRAWIDGAAPIDKELERHRATLANTCEQGLDALKAAWDALPGPIKKKLRPELDALKASADGYDRHRRVVSEQSESSTADDLNARLSTEKDSKIATGIITSSGEGVSETTDGEREEAEVEIDDASND
jgi:AAA domain